MTADRQQRVRSSMLWAAWADALGWISELTSEHNLKRRTKGRDLTQPWEWNRQVGGRMGVRVNLPEGCYSDDTQLRLSTARSISTHGFDAEAFAKVELPVWQSYALGAGRASKNAAAGMTRQSATWATNFYSQWHKSGGNGAAMRIQPHVYASRDLKSFEHLDDVIRNAVITHGHPRAIVGAVFHAVSLTLVLASNRALTVDDFRLILDVTRNAFVAFVRQRDLANYWRPRWEEASGESLEDAWVRTVEEINTQLGAAFSGFVDLRNAGRDRDLAEEGYRAIVRSLHLEDEQERGSGTTTALAATLLATALPDHPAQSAQLAASRLGTDTDTIATMAAAIVGASIDRPLISTVQDHNYIRVEADRMAEVGAGGHVPPFTYPDLLRWTPPKTALDSLGTVQGRLAVAGLGFVAAVDDVVYETRDARWRWVETDFGASLLIKYRHELRPLATDNLPREIKSIQSEKSPRDRSIDTEDSSPALFDPAVFSSWPEAFADKGVLGVVELLKLRGPSDSELGGALNWLMANASPAAVRDFIAQLQGSKRR